MRALFSLRTADWIPVSGGQLPSGREIALACVWAVLVAQFVPQSSPGGRLRWGGASRLGAGRAGA